MLNISLPDPVQRFVEDQAIAAGFNSASKYLSFKKRSQLCIIEQNWLDRVLAIEGFATEAAVKTDHYLINLNKDKPTAEVTKGSSLYNSD